MRRLGIRAKLFGAILAFAVLAGAGAWWYVNRLARTQAEQAAVHEAQRLLVQLREVREYYARNVIAPAQGGYHVNGRESQLVLFLRGRRSRAASAGLSESALNAESSTDTAIVIANCL